MASPAATTTPPTLQAPLRPISSAAPSTLIITTPSSAATPTPATPGSPSSGVKIILVAPCYGWACWDRSLKDAVIVIAILVGLAFIPIFICFCRKYRRRKRRIAEVEKGPDLVDERGKSRSRSRSRRRGVSLAGRWKGKERGRSGSRKGGIEGLENIEMGPAVARSLIESGVLNPTVGVTSTGGLGEEKKFEGGEYRMRGGLSPREGEKDAVFDQSDIGPVEREKRLPELMKEAEMAADDEAWRLEGTGKGS